MQLLDCTVFIAFENIFSKLVNWISPQNDSKILLWKYFFKSSQFDISSKSRQNMFSKLVTAKSSRQNLALKICFQLARHGKILRTRNWQFLEFQLAGTGIRPDKVRREVTQPRYRVGEGTCLCVREAGTVCVSVREVLTCVSIREVHVFTRLWYARSCWKYYGKCWFNLSPDFSCRVFFI